MNATDEESKMEEGLLMEESSRRRIYRRRRNRREEAKEIETDEESKHAESKEDDRDLDGVIPLDQEVQVEESKDRDTPRNDILSPVRASWNTSELSTATSIDSKDTTPNSPMLTRSSSILSKPEDKLKARFSQRLRRATDVIPEVHFVGEISEGVGFNGKFVSCKW